MYTLHSDAWFSSTERADKTKLNNECCQFINSVRISWFVMLYSIVPIVIQLPWKWKWNIQLLNKPHSFVNTLCDIQEFTFTQWISTSCICWVGKQRQIVPIFNLIFFQLIIAYYIVEFKWAVSDNITHSTKLIGILFEFVLCFFECHAIFNGNIFPVEQHFVDWIVNLTHTHIDAHLLFYKIIH